jgi:hypothetical protein
MDDDKAMEQLYQAAKFYQVYQDHIRKNPHLSHVSFPLWCYESIKVLQEAKKNRKK